MTYSIAYGLIAGIITYAVLNTVVWVIEKASGGRIVPFAKEIKDPWTYKIEGGVLPGWLTRMISGKKDFWRPHPEIDAAETGTVTSEDIAPCDENKGESEVVTSIDEKDHVHHA